MNFDEIEKMKDELKKVSAVYDIFDESARLDSKASNIEFLTSTKYIEKYLAPGMKILDLGAGTGRYSLYFAKRVMKLQLLSLWKNMLKLLMKLKRII